MTVVVGTAGHIDHGKTTLLRALTGIDADRLPEERRRGMTIDVGYAHLAFDDGLELDFVDVPGHDRLVGNMLVGAGEIDAAMLVVAADDGPRAQTIEHLALLDALGIGDGIAVVTKTGTVEPDRVDEVLDAVRGLLAGTSLAGIPILAVDSVSGAGLPALHDALLALAGRVAAAVERDPPVAAGSRLAVDRVFTVKGRGLVVTGTLRGRPLARGSTLAVVPGPGSARIREVQVHGRAVEAAPPGRTALNVSGVEADALRRGVVLVSDDAVLASSRLLVRLRRPLADRSRARLHLGTAAVDAAVGRSGRDAVDLGDGAAAILRLAEPAAVAAGDRFVLRRSGREPVVGGVVLDVAPPRGVSRRRQTPERVAALAGAVGAGGAGPDDPGAERAARLDLHGIERRGSEIRLAEDVAAAAGQAALDAVPPGAIIGRSTVRVATERSLRRLVTIGRDEAAPVAAGIIDDLVRSGRLVADGDRLRRPETAAPAEDPALVAAMDRLERALAVPAPAPLAEAARASGCPPEGVRALERSGRIVLVAPDLAYAMSTYRDLAARALAAAADAPLTPAAFRDATGTSRKYVMAILEDLDRRGVLRRTPDGHVPGPRAPRQPVGR